MVTRYRSISLREARRLPPIPSGYETSRIFEFDSEELEDSSTWRLTEKELPIPLRKEYDDGDITEWLASYSEGASLEALKFLVADVNGAVEGLLTWHHLRWNATIWLIDIRVRSEARQRGIGGGMLDELKGLAVQSRVRGITIETQNTNHPAVGFYQRHGFRISGFNDSLYGNRGSADQEVAIFLFWPNPDY